MGKDQFPSVKLERWGSRDVVRRADVLALVEEGMRRDPDLTLKRISWRMGYSDAWTDKMLKRERVSLSTVVELLRAVHVDPWEVGL